MAAQTLEELVETAQGLTMPADADEKSEILDDAAGYVLMDLPTEALQGGLSEESVPTAGLTITDKIVVNVHVLGVQAVQVPTMFRKAFQEGNHQYRADYVYDIRSTKLYIWERGSSTALSTGKAFTIAKPVGLAGTETSITEIPHYDGLRLVALRARILLLGEVIISVRENDLITAASLTLPTVPVAPSVPTIVAGTITAGTASAATAIVGTSAPGTSVAGTGTAATAATSAVGAVGSASGTTATGGTNSKSAPSDETPATIPSAAPGITDAEWNTAFKVTLGNAPPGKATAATTPTWNSTAELASGQAASDWTTYLGTEDVEILDRLLAHFDAVLKEYTTNSQQILQGFEADLKLWQTEVKRIVQNEEWLLAHQTQTLREAVNSHGNQVQEAVSKFQAEMQGGIADAKNSTDASIATVRAAVDASIATARVDTEKSVVTAQNALQANIATARLSTEASIATGNMLTESNVADMRAETESNIADMQAVTQISISNMEAGTQASIATARNATETSIAQIQATMAALISNWEGKIQQHQEDLSQYLAEIERLQKVTITRIQLGNTRIQMLQAEINRNEAKYFKRFNLYVENYGIFHSHYLRAYAM